MSNCVHVFEREDERAFCIYCGKGGVVTSVGFIPDQPLAPTLKEKLYTDVLDALSLWKFDTLPGGRNHWPKWALAADKLLKELKKDVE